MDWVVISVPLSWVLVGVVGITEIIVAMCRGHATPRLFQRPCRLSGRGLPTDPSSLCGSSGSLGET